MLSTSNSRRGSGSSASSGTAPSLSWEELGESAAAGLSSLSPHYISFLEQESENQRALILSLISEKPIKVIRPTSSTLLVEDGNGNRVGYDEEDWEQFGINPDALMSALAQAASDSGGNQSGFGGYQDARGLWVGASDKCSACTYQSEAGDGSRVLSTRFIPSGSVAPDRSASSRRQSE